MISSFFTRIYYCLNNSLRLHRFDETYQVTLRNFPVFPEALKSCSYRCYTKKTHGLDYLLRLPTFSMCLSSNFSQTKLLKNLASKQYYSTVRSLEIFATRVTSEHASPQSRALLSILLPHNISPASFSLYTR